MISDYSARLAEMPPGWHSMPPLKEANRIKELLAQNPGNRHLLYFLALAQARDGFAADAVATLKALIAAHPEDKQAREALERFLTESPLKTPESAPEPRVPGPQPSSDNAPASNAAIAPSFRAVALISAYNEGDVIYHVIGDLIANGLDVYLIDNNSTDNTIAEASRWLGRGLLKVERFPQDVGPEYSQQCDKEYIWREILRRKEELALTLGADWYIHADADEFRESPWPGKTLAEAIREVDLLGYNALNFALFNFRPTDDGFVAGSDVRKHLTGYEPGDWFDSIQVKAWKNPGQRVGLVQSGGHSVAFPNRRVFPVSFILRHYPIRGENHGKRKIFNDRLPRFNSEERAAGWHVQYNDYATGKARFLFDPAKLIAYDGNCVRAQLLARSNLDLLLVASMAKEHPIERPPEEQALFSWVGRKLGMREPLSPSIGRQASQFLGELIKTQARGEKDIPLKIDKQLAALLLVLNQAQSAYARLRGDSFLANAAHSTANVLERLRRAGNVPEQALEIAPSSEPGARADKAPENAGDAAVSPGSGDFFDANEMENIDRLIASYVENPTDCGAREQLGLLQTGLTNFLVTAETEKLEGLFNGSLGRVFRSLLKSGFPSEPPCEPSQARLAVLDEAIAKSEMQAGALDFRPLLARMLCAPAHLGSTKVAPERIPAWILNDYFDYLLQAPSVFVVECEAEHFHDHMLCLTRAILQRIRTEPDKKLTADLASAFAAKAKYIPLYLSNRNTRELAETRAAILEFVLARSGARLDFIPPKRPKARNKIKVGYLNTHFGAQTETYVTLPTLQLDPNKFEICLFAVASNPGPVENRCRSLASSFTLLPKTLHQQVKAIREARLDILIVGTNVTAVTNQVLLIALHRLAPLQLASYCSPVSTGVRNIDGYLTGTLSDFPGLQEHFSENLIFCDGPPGCLDYTVESEGASARFDRAGLGLAEDDLIFVNAASCFKILPEMQATWAKILKAVPRSRLLLLPFNPNWSSRFPVKQFERGLTEAFARHGLGREAFILASSLPSRADVKALERVADVYLDTFPFSGSISVIDPLELGMPVVVWEGKTHRSQAAAALLRELGVPELITQDEESYVRLSVKLATDLKYRALVRERIVEAMARKPKFINPKAYAESLGSVLESMLKRNPKFCS